MDFKPFASATGRFCVMHAAVVLVIYNRYRWQHISYIRGRTRGGVHITRVSILPRSTLYIFFLNGREKNKMAELLNILLDEFSDLLKWQQSQYFNQCYNGFLCRNVPFWQLSTQVDKFEFYYCPPFLCSPVESYPNFVRAASRSGRSATRK